MLKKVSSFLAGIVSVACLALLNAQAASVATIPQGLMTYVIKHGTLTTISLPLSGNIVYSGTVSSVDDSTIRVADAPALFATSLTDANARYFVKLLSGSEKGRVMLIAANTADSLTLDTTDGGTKLVALTTPDFGVAVGDSFEIFPADTLSSIFGDNTAQNPLVFAGSTNVFTADTLSIYNTTTNRFQPYYFNTTNNQWQTLGSNANKNDTILYPGAALAVQCRSTSPDTSFALAGRVAEVPVLTKTTGIVGSPVFVSSGYATDLTLSQLEFGSNWLTGPGLFTANTVSILNVITQRYDAYYQQNDLSWHQSSNPALDESGVSVVAGGAIVILQRATVTGADCFLSSVMPYSLD